MGCLKDKMPFWHFENALHIWMGNWALSGDVETKVSNEHLPFLYCFLHWFRCYSWKTQNSGSAQWVVVARGDLSRYFLVRFPYSEGFAAKMHFVAKKKHLTASPDISLKDYSRPGFRPTSNNGELLTKATMRLFFCILGSQCLKYMSLLPRHQKYN